MSAETRHCNLITAHSVCTLETITNMVLLNVESVYALHAKILFFELLRKNGKHIWRAG